MLISGLETPLGAHPLKKLFMDGHYLNDDAVFFIDKFQISDCIFIFGFAVVVVIEFDFRDIELN